MPKGISGMYELILGRLCRTGGREEMDMRKRILMWVTMAYEPVSIPEMQYACTTEDGDTSFDPDQVVLPTEHQILESCGSLLEKFDGNKLRFTHRTVKEFLLAPKDNYSPTFQEDEKVVSCLVNEGEAHASMAFTCRKLIESQVHCAGEILTVSTSHTAFFQTLAYSPACS